MNRASYEFNKQLELDVLVNGLTEITLDYVINRTAKEEKLDEIIIPEGVTSIGVAAFRWQDNIITLTIPDGVERIGNHAFTGCRGLTSVTIGNGVESIEDFAFDYCNSLTDVTIGNGVKSIGTFTFWQDFNLKSVTFVGKTLDEVEAMKYYPWEVSPEKIHVQDI